MSIVRSDINLHPTSHSPSSIQSRTFDLIVIGGGPGGEMMAMRATRGGLSALIIESELIGGECPYWACVPSKALLRPAEALSAANAVGGAREIVGSSGTRPNREGVWKRRDFFAKHWEDSANVKLMADHDVVFVRGFGRIAGVKKVTVQEWGKEKRVEFEARHAVAVCTGSEPVIPAGVPGMVDSKPWTPREAVSASFVPEHLIILGAGPVGAEMATAYSSFGGKVTLISSGKEVLPRFEPQAGKRVRESLVKGGVDVRLGTRITKVERLSSTEIHVLLSTGETVSGSELLVAAGRKPKTTDVGLDTIGLQDGSVLDVDDTLCVHAASGKSGEEWLYAIGDTNGRSPLTHMAKYQGKVGGDTVVARAKGTFHQNKTTENPTPFTNYSATAQNPEYTPQVTFTTPQVASVGLTLAEAQKRVGGGGITKKVKEVAVAMAGPGTFLHAEGYDGWAQWVVEEESQLVLGATFVGADVADLLHASTVAVVGQVPLPRLWHAVPPFPTTSEVYTALLDKAGL